MSDEGEAYIPLDPEKRGRSRRFWDAVTLPPSVSQKITVIRTAEGCRVVVNGIDITYWIAAGSSPSVAFPEGKPPVLTVQLTAEDFDIQEESP